MPQIPAFPLKSVTEERRPEVREGSRPEVPVRPQGLAEPRSPVRPTWTPHVRSRPAWAFRAMPPGVSGIPANWSWNPRSIASPLPTSWEDPFWRAVHAVQKQVGKAQEAVRKHGPEIVSWIPYTHPGFAATAAVDNAAALLREGGQAWSVLRKLRDPPPAARRFVTYPGAPRVSYHVDLLRPTGTVQHTEEGLPQRGGQQPDPLEPIRTQVEGLLQRAGKELNIPWTSIPVVIGGVQPHTELFDRWRPASIWDLYRRWQHIKTTPISITPIWYDRAAYNRTTTRTSLSFYRPEILAHELGHYADLYWKKGPYKWTPGPFWRPPRYENVPFFDVLAKEIAATLFARKILSPEEWQKGRETLEAGLATYLEAFRRPQHPLEMFTEGIRRFPDAPPPPEDLFQNWRTYLRTAIQKRDRGLMENLIRRMMEEKGRRSSGSPVSHQPVDATLDKSVLTWHPDVLPEFREFVRALLDEEYRRMYENAADK